MPVRASRFHGSRDIKNTLRRGEAARAEDFNVRKLSPGKSRTAIVISKKVHKHAVVRNRIRRRISEIIRLIRAEQTMTDDIVVVVKNPELARQNHQLLQQQVSQAVLGRKR